jgi:hypothetical protein
MGIKIATVLLDQERYDPEQRLWQAVLVNAFEDVVSNASDKKAAIAKWQAHNWFTKDVKDMVSVCYLAGFDPEYVQERYYTAVDNSSIKFNERQLAWGKYYDVLMRYHNAKDIKQRRVIKKELENARLDVFKTKFIE